MVFIHGDNSATNIHHSSFVIGQRRRNIQLNGPFRRIGIYRYGRVFRSFRDSCAHTDGYAGGVGTSDGGVGDYDGVSSIGGWRHGWILFRGGKSGVGSPRIGIGRAGFGNRGGGPSQCYLS